MVRKFIAFDSKTINQELRSLPELDFRDLTHAMDLFQDGEAGGYTVRKYDDDLMMIKGNRQGRCLWFTTETIENGVQILVALLVYKKESQEVPARVLDTARERLKNDREK